MSVDIGLHPILARHTPESRFTHWNLSEADLIERVQLNWSKRVVSYREGVYEVDIHPSGFFSPVVYLQAGDTLVGNYESRIGSETPRKTTLVYRPGATKSPAKAVNVICYHRDVLAEDNEQVDHEWNIVSINARITDEPEPMTVGTLLANHFKTDGGTATNMTSEQFETALRTSYNYWKDKGLLAPSSNWSTYE